jgi:hypothetical protein
LTQAGDNFEINSNKPPFGAGNGRISSLCLHPGAAKQA